MQTAQLTTSLQGVIVSDKSLHILWTNEQLKLMLEQPSAHFEGQTLTDFFKIEDVDGFLEDLDNARMDSESIFREVRYNRPSGYSITLRFAINPVESADHGNPIYHISVGTEVGQGHNMVGESQGGKRSSSKFHERYALTQQSFSAAKALFLELDRLIDSEQLFLDPDFVLAKASKMLTSNDLYLSQAVNFFSGFSFASYVNSKRIGYMLAMRERLVDDEQAIWSHAGFGSYHAFYRHVRKYHGMTPAEMLNSVMDTAGVPMSPPHD